MSNENRNPTIVDSLVGIGYAPFTESINGGYTYENIVWLPDLEGGGRSFTASPQGDFKKVVANGKTVIMFKKRSGYDIKATLMSLIDDVKEAWLGQKTTTSGGFAEYADSKPAPRFALVAAFSLYGSTKKKVETYFNCAAEDPERSAKGDSDDFDPDYPEYTIHAYPRKDMLVMTEEFVDTLPTTIAEPTFPSSKDEEKEEDGET